MDKKACGSPNPEPNTLMGSFKILGVWFVGPVNPRIEMFHQDSAGIISAPKSVNVRYMQRRQTRRLEKADQLKRLQLDTCTGAPRIHKKYQNAYNPYTLNTLFTGRTTRMSVD